MTRGKIIYIDKNKVMHCSCEFNGDMHPECKGDQIIENFQNGYFKSVSDYEKYVTPVNGMAIVNYKKIQEILTIDSEQNEQETISTKDEMASYIEQLSKDRKTRDISRIEPILDELKILWEKHSDLRLGQLICNIVLEDKLYYLEDDKMLERMQIWDKERG